MRQRRTPAEVRAAKRFGQRLRDKRIARGFTTQAALAEALGLNPSTIYRIELGRVTASPDTITTLCRVLRCKPTDLTK